MNKKNFSHHFVFTLTLLATLSIILCFNIVSLFLPKSFFNTLKHSIFLNNKTEELFDDVGGIKFVSLFFPNKPLQAQSPLFNFQLNLDYDYEQNENGVVTFFNAKGLVFAPESGVVFFEKSTSGQDTLFLHHNSSLVTVFEGKFMFGVCNKQQVQKGDPLAVLTNSTLKIFLTDKGKVLENFQIVHGEVLWQN